MKKTDHRHYNRSEKRLLSIEMDYWCAFNGKDTPYGRVIDVVYSGNSVYGDVYVRVSDQWFLILKKTNQYKPLLTTDFMDCKLIKVPEPEAALHRLD